MSTNAFETYRTEWQAWRGGWEQWLSQPHGWLSATSVNWLDSTPRRFDGTPGLWWQIGDKLLIEPNGTTMSFDGNEITSVQEFALAEGPDDQRVTAGDIEVGITYRDGYHVITYDPGAEARQTFDGVPTFEFNSDWVITGKFEAFKSARSLALDTVGWNSHEYLTPGVVRFQLQGQTYEMQVIVPHGQYATVFADATSGDTTYPAGRALDIPAPDEDSTVTLDFNRAVNLPFAFSDYFPICPTPPATNRYPFRVEAGEQTPVK
ncbi:DUF1684 domain-containing protein [Jidongwangia harbinensis]|uniref:DUF1684 domain-containing protein n=1 Tax=Jidongwangia harbinensis TaxID=2878561 RepID=UPI001CD9AF7C|nr:DUF1684 domain-containing protein [Jidongwangia harbinensis]MCA2217507.1 DUF1684 domain-containing protein [Jidongwangia harbinensis]